MYVSADDKRVANFDAEMTLGGTKLLPSFYSQNGTTDFFDIGEQNEVIPDDLWLIYLSFFPRDREKSL